MKHKEIILLVIMVAMLITAALIYNSAITLSGLWGIPVKGVDNIAKALAVFACVPGVAINNVRKEARNE